MVTSIKKISLERERGYGVETQGWKVGCMTHKVSLVTSTDTFSLSLSLVALPVSMLQSELPTKSGLG